MSLSSEGDLGHPRCGEGDRLCWIESTWGEISIWDMDEFRLVDPVEPPGGQYMFSREFGEGVNTAVCLVDVGGFTQLVTSTPACLEDWS